MNSITIEMLRMKCSFMYDVTNNYEQAEKLNLKLSEMLLHLQNNTYNI